MKVSKTKIKVDNQFERHIKLSILSGYAHFVAVYHVQVLHSMTLFYLLNFDQIKVLGSMGPNTPQKFSAAKLFGFGGGSSDTKKGKWLV